MINVRGTSKTNRDKMLLIDTFKTEEKAEQFCEQWGWVYDDGKRSYFMWY